MTITPYPTMLPGQKLAAGTVNQITSDINALQGVAGSAAAAEAAADAAETAQAAAEAAEVAAEAAVTAALGPVELTNVAGTDTAYTADCTHGNTAGRSFWFTPHVDGGVTPTLSINGGTARQLRTETGGVLSALLLRGGVGYLIRSTGTTFNVLGLRLTQRWQSRLMLVGSSATLDFYDTDGGAVTGRISCDSTGRILLASNGSTGLEIQADLDVKAPGRFITSTNREVYHLDNPPDFDWNDVGEINTTTAGPGDETIIEALVATDTTPVQPTGADLNRRGWVNVNNGWVDFDGLPKHASFEVGIGASKVVNLYTGTATNWNGRTSNVVQVTGPAIVRASTFQEVNDILLTSTAALTDVAAPTIPVYGRTWVIAGQSWIKRAGKGGRAGIMATYRRLADAMPATRIIDGAVGASGLFSGAEGDAGEDGETVTDTSNAYWNVVTGNPGPNALILRDAILAWVAANPAQPFPEAVIWNYGLPDLNVIAASGDYTPASWTQGQTDLQAWLDTELSTALSTTVELNHIMCPLPARKLGVWPEDVWYPLRRAQIDVITTAPRTFRGPDIYDAVRMWNDGHHGFAMQKRWGARWPYFIENALRSATHYTGPRITDVHEISGSEYWVRIERGYVDGAGTTASLTRPAQPAGFGLLPAGSDYFATRVDVARYTWTTDDNPGGDPLDDDILVITPRTAASGLRPVFMYGSGYETAQPSRIIRDLRTFMPLQIA